MFILENGDPTEALSTWQDNCFVSNHTTMLYGIFIHFSKGFSLTLNKNGSSNTIMYFPEKTFLLLQFEEEENFNEENCVLSIFQIEDN